MIHMKKRVPALLLAAMMAASPFALAEGDEDIPDFENATRLEAGTVTRIDLNADGADEELRLRWDGDPDYPQLTAVVTGTDGAVYEYTTDITYYERIYVCDIDNDGRDELLLSGDMASSDYYTWCLRYDDENGLTVVQFPNTERDRSAAPEAHTICGYGLLTDITDGVMTLFGTQDILGTWFASRQVSYNAEDGCFDFADGGAYVIDLSDHDWSNEYRTLCTTCELPATVDGAAVTLAVGTRLVPSASDLESYVDVLCEDGTTARLEIAVNTDNYGYLIAGMEDSACFEFIPYAD